MEAKLQKKIVKFLKERGAYVIKTRPGLGTPVGCPDIIFLFGRNWGVIEVKANEKAPFRVGQQATLNFLKGQNSYVYIACPENWPIIKQVLLSRFY